LLYFNSKAAYKVLESPGKRPRKGPGKSWKTGSWGLWQPWKVSVVLVHFKTAAFFVSGSRTF